MIQELELSAGFTIHRGHDNEFNEIKDECIKYAKLNDSFVVYSKSQTRDNSIWMEINAKCFLQINEKIKNYVEGISNRKFTNYAEHFWIYTQTKGFDMEWMHQHLLVHPPGRSNIKTDFTFTYYLQTPKDIKGDEGHIVFETEDKIRHKFLPQEGDFFIFPADIRHTAIPTPNSELDRIVYAGNFCLDVENQVKYLSNTI
jgi:predicted 2-oxoglutarate/Fe(II)-dependent dioxygenase YbiX